MAPVIAVIGAGAMGSAVAARLVQRGARVLTLLEGRGPVTWSRAIAAGMEPATLPDVAGADLILSIVPPDQAHAVVEQLAPALAAQSHRAPFLDCNALSPESKCALSERLAQMGCEMIDAGIIGPPPGSGGAEPRFYLSGPGVERAQVLAELGVELRLLDGPVGAAAALKMCYAGINKGLTALTTAMLLAAERAGAGEALREEMAYSLPHLLVRARRSTPAMYPKAYRWAPEMREIAAFLIADAPAAMVFEGAARFFEERALDFDGERWELAVLAHLLEAPEPGEGELS